MLICLSFSTMAQDRRHHITVSPISLSELGIGIGTSYEYSVTSRVGLEIPLIINWNFLPPIPRDYYKTRVIRLMPTVKYYVVDKSRFKYGVGLGVSYGMGQDDKLSENHNSSFKQVGAFVNNGIMFFNSKGSFGIGADLSIGYHVYDNIDPQYKDHYGNELARFAFKFIFRI